MIKNHHKNITGFIRKDYYGYFGVKLGDQGKSRATQTVCCVCVADLRERAKGKQKAFSYAVPAIWRGLKITANIAIFAVAVLTVTVATLSHNTSS
jgi:hypothetical protein